MREWTLGRERLGDAAAASRLEWLVTNGIGGYASGTVGGALTRRYHGLLVAALEPPARRTLLFAKLAERVVIDDREFDLDTNLWASGTLAPSGFLNLESFCLEDTVPTWTWAIGDTRIEKRVWMEQGENTTCVQYRLTHARGPVTLSLRALVNHRDAHATTRRGGPIDPSSWAPVVEPATGGLRVVPFEGAAPLWLFAPGAEIQPAQEWYRHFGLALEHARGLDAVEDHLMAAQMVFRLAPGEAVTVVASTRHDAGAASGPLALMTSLARRRAHERALRDAWTASQPAAERIAPAWVRQLVLSADAFVVERPLADAPRGHGVIAGYPWFGEWGRDAMIALPGLAVTTGRPELARSILRTYARSVDQGMLPNVFPDGGEAPEYNTVDAALWLFQAVRATDDAFPDDAFLAEVFPALESVISEYTLGTRHGIAVDPEDGLVRAGEPGVQLTWMDARVDGSEVTPRHGKPVEINALWYSALSVMDGFATRLGIPADGYARRAAQVARSFGKFWNEETGFLFDVLDGPEGADPTLRPNQVFAVALPECALTREQSRAVVEACGRSLLTSHGLRSLAPDDPRYVGTYTGAPSVRDAAYHQGTVWTWLLPAFALAHFRVHGDRDAALAFLDPIASLAGAYGVGSLPELADGDAPFAPRGCIAQAWSVAEALRAWHVIASPLPRAPRPPRTSRARRAPAVAETSQRRRTSAGRTVAKRAMSARGATPKKAAAVAKTAASTRKAARRRG